MINLDYQGTKNHVRFYSEVDMKTIAERNIINARKHRYRCSCIAGFEKLYDKAFLAAAYKGKAIPEEIALKVLAEMGWPDPCEGKNFEHAMPAV